MQNTLTIPDHAARIAVAVSGGADSMALVHMVSRQHKDVHAITVDHALRSESADEAKQVGAWLKGFPNVTHIILKWEGDKPDTGRMESARTARYALMADYCRAHDIKHLAVAHHRDDQAETFFMRLSHGSGLDGLAAMREFQSYDDQVTLWRPLLETAGHDDLVTYCKDNFIHWIEDPSNVNDAYTRARLRKTLQSEGLDSKRLSQTMRRLERASDALRILADRLLEKAMKEKSEDSVTIDLNVLRAEPFELSVRVIRTLIDDIGNANNYGARFEKVEEVARFCLDATESTATTLGGCILKLRQNGGILRIEAEKTMKTLPLTANGL